MRQQQDEQGRFSICSRQAAVVLENQLSISEGALGQWVAAARKGLGTLGSRTVAELESEILQLRKALNEARLERDILKKQQCILPGSR